MISVNYKLDFDAEKSDGNPLKSNIIRYFLLGFNSVHPREYL